MKRNNLIFAVFAATVVAAASCNKERATSSDLDGGVPAGSPMTITAGVDSKIYYQSGKTICWVDGDRLQVFNEKNAGSTFITHSSTLKEAEFTCENWVGGIPVFAVHSSPASAGQCKYNGSKATAYLNPSQAIAHRNSFSKTAGLSVGTVSGSEGSYVVSEMKNVFGSIGFTLKSSDVKSVTLTANNGEYIAGWVDVDYNGGEPVWTAKVDGDMVSSKSIEITVGGSASSDGSFIPNTTYYINVLPQSFEKGLTIKLVNKDGEVATRVIDKKIVIERSKKHSITTAIDNITIDCTTVGASTFKYDNGGEVSNLPKRSDPCVASGTDFWAESYHDYLFNGAVRYWPTGGGCLNFLKDTYVRFPQIDGFKLAEITSLKVVHSAARNYKITAEPAESYALGVAVAGGGEQSLSSSSAEASFILTDEYDADKDYYIVCSNEAGIRFKLIYQKVNIAQE